MSTQIAGTLAQLPMLAGTLVLPYFISALHTDQKERINNFLERWLPAIVLGWSILSVALGLAYALLAVPLFGQRFAASTLPLWPLLAAHVIAAPWIMGHAPLATSHERMRIHLAVGSLTALFNIALNLLLIPRFGLLGCAWATFGSCGPPL